MTSFNWKISGKAGEGIKKAGLILSKTCLEHGLYVHGYTEYPSLIRGGQTSFQVLAGKQNQLAPQTKIDLFFDLSQSKIFLSDKKEINIPFDKLAKQAGGSHQIINTIALGISCYLLGLNLNLLEKQISLAFQTKDKKIIDLNLQAAKISYQYAQTNLSENKLSDSWPKQKLNQLFLTGNQALSLGAIAGGMKFFTAYPMTPATSILHYLAAKAKQLNLVVRHAEDEIGVINSAIGASFAGVRSMVATSGGGFSLMTEALGLSGVTETPIVIVNAMRPGPASGMPTWSGQGDLLFTIHASQDEFPRIILTPGDPQEAFELTKLAQNLAEKYQLPIIILTDKYLGESYFTVDQFPSKHQNQRYGLADTKNLDNQTPFPRYQLTKTGISPRSLPGQTNGVHLTNSYDHDQLGYATENSQTRIDQVNKRNLKLKTLAADIVQPKLYGPKTASTTLISWGSNKGSVLAALTQLPQTNFIHLPWVWPFPAQQLKQLLNPKSKLITLECNSTGQLNQLIRQQTSIEIKHQLLKYDGRPIYPEEIIDYVKKTTN